MLTNEIEDTNNFSKKKKEEGVKDERTTDVPSQYILGTLRKYDGVTGQQRERLKTIGFMSKLNNNSARASHFFVHSFAVPAQLRGEVTKF